MTKNYDGLQHVFLIAMPQLQDPQFSQSVIYLWEYNAQGAMGIIINQPLDVRLGELLQQLDIPLHVPQIDQLPILRGGPVAADRGFIIRRRYKMLPDNVNPLVEITVSSSKEELVALANGEFSDDALVALGCAGWAAGQLDIELANNDWLIVPFSEYTLFGEEGDQDNQSYKWHMAAARAGIDLTRMSLEAGHA